VKGTVQTLVAIHHGRRIDVAFLGNLFGEGLVPKLPAEAFRDFPSDFRSAASELPFYGDNSKHG